MNIVHVSIAISYHFLNGVSTSAVVGADSRILRTQNFPLHWHHHCLSHLLLQLHAGDQPNLRQLGKAWKAWTISSFTALSDIPCLGNASSSDELDIATTSPTIFWVCCPIRPLKHTLFRLLQRFHLGAIQNNVKHPSYDAFNPEHEFKENTGIKVSQLSFIHVIPWSQTF